MSFPRPTPALVIRYSYLWRSEFLRGQEEGLKDRPCAIVMASKIENDRQTVVVLPITHTPPHDSKMAVEIPADVKKRLGLDEARSWVMINEANRFVWPGPDLRPATRGDPNSIVYGQLPDKLFGRIKTAFVKALEERTAKSTTRTE